MFEPWGIICPAARPLGRGDVGSRKTCFFLFNRSWLAPPTRLTPATPDYPRQPTSRNSGPVSSGGDVWTGTPFLLFLRRVGDMERLFRRCAISIRDSGRRYRGSLSSILWIVFCAEFFLVVHSAVHISVEQDSSLGAGHTLA